MASCAMKQEGPRLVCLGMVYGVSSLWASFLLTRREEETRNKINVNLIKLLLDYEPPDDLMSTSNK